MTPSNNSDDSDVAKTTMQATPPAMFKKIPTNHKNGDEMKYTLIALLIILSSNAYAETTICKISGMFMFTKVSWDNNSGEAKISDLINRTYGGRHVFSREHDKGRAHSLRFVFDDKTAAGTDMAEFVIYPKNKEGKQSILGIAFRLNDNDRFVDFSYGSHDIQCLSD